MNDLTDSISWPMKDPQWISKVVIMGLISLIPILGSIVLLGWMLGALDNIRQGRQELPAAGFGHIGRGVNLFVVLLIFGIALAVVFLVCFLIGLAIASAGGQANNGAIGGVGFLFILLGYGVLLAGALGLYFLLPAIVLATERGGIGSGVNLPKVIGMARINGSATLFAGLFTLVAYLIGSIGSVLCGIGVILTVAYGYAIIAGIVAHYERQIGGGQPPLQPTAPAV